MKYSGSLKQTFAQCKRFLERTLVGPSTKRKRKCLRYVGYVQSKIFIWNWKLYELSRDLYKYQCLCTRL